jgi:protein-S-isoprenylcysteine O-methyltransferase Ste14
MNLKLTVIFCFSVLYCILEVYLNLRQKQSSKVEKRNDKGSLAGLYLSIGLGYFLAFSVGSLKTGRIYHWNTLFAIGFILVALGLIIRILALITLKKYFTYSVSKIENHKLIETGLYKRIRHPGYLGQIIIFLGISVTLSNWLSVLLMMISVLTGYIYRINTEERFMSDQMGKKYSDYKLRTKRLIPGIY